jgi:hypothetical protein
MTYAFIRDVPFNEEQYGRIRTRIGDETPAGLVAHLVLRQEHGLQYVDVWESETDWERFLADRVMPAVRAATEAKEVPPPSASFPSRLVDVIDAMVGSPAARTA